MRLTMKEFSDQEPDGMGLFRVTFGNGVYQLILEAVDRQQAIADFREITSCKYEHQELELLIDNL